MEKTTKEVLQETIIETALRNGIDFGLCCCGICTNTKENNFVDKWLERNKEAVNERQKLVEERDTNQRLYDACHTREINLKEQNQKLLDSNRELIGIVEDIYRSYMLENGRFTPNCDGDQLVIDLKEAIINAKSNIE